MDSQYQFATEQHYNADLVERLASFASDLDRYGLNLCSVLAPSQLQTAGLSVPLVDSAPTSGVYVLVGNGGGRFWETVGTRCPGLQSLLDQDNRELIGDPVDRISRSLVEAALRTHLPSDRFKLLFPLPADQSSAFLPLQKLGRVAGWHQPSPLGSGMHPDYGLWFAYRVVIWIDAQSSADKPPNRQPDAIDDPGSDEQSVNTLSDQCLRCESKACVSACPAEAIDLARAPDMSACASFRLQDSSPCVDRCLAREACPAVARRHRYPREQIEFHYRLALHTLRRYYSD